MIEGEEENQQQKRWRDITDVQQEESKLLYFPEIEID